MAKKITMKKLDEVLSKGCRDSLKEFFSFEGITQTGRGGLYANKPEGIGGSLIRRYKNFRSSDYKNIEAEYYALANGPCGVFAGSYDDKLRYKKDLEELMGKI